MSWSKALQIPAMQPIYEDLDDDQCSKDSNSPTRDHTETESDNNDLNLDVVEPEPVTKTKDKRKAKAKGKGKAKDKDKGKAMMQELREQIKASRKEMPKSGPQHTVSA